MEYNCANLNREEAARASGHARAVRRTCGMERGDPNAASTFAANALACASILLLTTLLGVAAVVVATTR